MFFRPLYIPLVLAIAAAALAVDLACSSTSPTTYNQAAMPIRPPPPPRAPVFNPAEDAPHTFQPGRPSPVQPGPRPTRVLPQDEHTRRQPGLWASKAPDASASAEVELFGVPISSPSTPHERTETSRCAEQAKLLFNEEAYAKRDPTWLKCFAHYLIQACLDSGVKNMQDKMEAGSTSPIHRDRLAALTPAAALATKEAERLCPPQKDAETQRGYADLWVFVSNTVWASP